jgi:hypothetical protein
MLLRRAVHLCRSSQLRIPALTPKLHEGFQAASCCHPVAVGIVARYQQRKAAADMRQQLFRFRCQDQLAAFLATALALFACTPSQPGTASHVMHTATVDIC